MTWVPSLAWELQHALGTAKKRKKRRKEGGKEGRRKKERSKGGRKGGKEREEEERKERRKGGRIKGGGREERKKEGKKEVGKRAGIGWSKSSFLTRQLIRATGSLFQNQKWRICGSYRESSTNSNKSIRTPWRY